MGLLAFAISIVATAMMFIPSVRLPGFVIGIFGIIFGVVAGYQKEKKEKDNKEKNTKKKDSKALEIGAIIISGAVCVSYLLLLYIS